MMFEPYLKVRTYPQIDELEMMLKALFKSHPDFFAP